MFRGDSSDSCIANRDGCPTGDVAGKRYYVLAADIKYLLICEYGNNSSDAEIIL